jgi:8-oxo-dGTP diphosphatase
MDEIRNSAKAIIIANERLLVTRNADTLGTFYLLPGGGQRHGETLLAALVRECREEIAAEIIVGELLFVRDYIAGNHEFAESEGRVHQVEFMFHCHVHDGEQPQVGNVPDMHQTGVDWLPLDVLSQVRFYPAALVDPLCRLLRDESADVRYLGDVN